MIDATTGMEAQDMNIWNLIIRNRKGCVLAVNKWDLFIKDSSTLKEYTASLKERLSPFEDVPIVFTSVIKMQRVQDVLDAIAKVNENYSRRIATARLNEIMLPIIAETPPPATKGKYVKIKYVTQLPTKFPSFAFFCNLPQYVKEAYRRFIENRLRENFELTGCPVQIYFRKK
jgi:GTP-binding protein